MARLNRLSCTISNTPGLSGALTLSTAVSGARAPGAGQNGQSFTCLFKDGAAWEIRSGCVYTHSGTSLSRGTIESTSAASDAAIALTSSTVVSNIVSAAELEAFTAKQAALTSGENIKTVAGQSILGLGNLALPSEILPVAFNSTLQFTQSGQMPTQYVTGVIPFTVNLTNAIDGVVMTVDLVANGTHLPTIGSGMREWRSSARYDNRNGIRNMLTAWMRAGQCWYSWDQALDGAVEAAPAAPSFSSAPVIPGPPIVGVARSYTRGTFTGVPFPGVTQEWLIDDGVVSGATSSSYTAISGDVGKTLKVRQTATNTSGTASSTSAGFVVATTATVPAAPTIGTATAGVSQASVAFTAPVNDGGSTLIDFTVTMSPGGATATGTSSPVVVTGLTNGTAYTATVRARNSVGSSAASAASNSVTPIGTGLRASGLAYLTESGNDTTGWSYTTQSGAQYSNTQSIVDKALPAGGDGYVEFTIGHVPANTSGIGIGYRVNSTVPGGYAQTVHGLLVTDHYYYVGGGTFTDATVFRTALQNDKVRLVFAGTTVTIQVSSDGGTTFSVLHTVTGVNNNVVRNFMVYGDNPGRIAATLKQIGLV